MKNIALIGLGPHAQRIYYPFIEKLCSDDENISIKLVIDLESRADDIKRYLSVRDIQPHKILLLDRTKQINPDEADPKVRRALKQLGITHVIIATEPKAHKAYIEECIRSEIPALVDKPITTPIGLMNPTSETTSEAASKIRSDLKYLIELKKEYPKSRILVQCQRRNHKGYKLVMNRLAEVVVEYGIPITYINIHHSDGAWNMPSEFFSRENHPYKYGYGKLMHSGYHFIDLLCELQAINQKLENKKTEEITIFNQFISPNDHASVIDNDDYHRLFDEEKSAETDFTYREKTDNFGELDVFAQLQYKNKDKVITTAQMSLMQSGFSQRGWSSLPADTYKSNGRVRHESINIHVGPLYNIQVHSYQEAQIGEPTANKHGIGGKDHFDIYIFKNSNLLGGKPFEYIAFGDGEKKDNAGNNAYLGHNELARHETLMDLLNNTESRSEIETHMKATSLLAALCNNQARQQSGLMPYTIYKDKELFDE